MFQLVNKSSGYLFSSSRLSDIIENQRGKLTEEIDRLEPNRLLNTSPNDLENYFIEKYTINPPILHREGMVVSEQETKVDVSQDQNRFFRDRSQPFFIPGQHIDIEIPFEGEPNLLYSQPSTMTFSPPRAEVRGQIICLGFDVVNNAQSPDIRKETDSILGNIEEYLAWISGDLSNYNNELPSESARLIAARRERILENQKRISALGIPLKYRPDAQKTYVVPDVKRKIIPTLPQASNAPFEPEPILEMENYEHILTVVQNMAHVIERSPSAFQTMREEDLRQHFLVQLNGQFEGAATGETFNVSGKTDILLRAKDRNIFIAECKFWKGPKLFLEAIDQLLGYTAWRDTKTAILIFNRETSMSTVLEGIRTVTPNHKYFKRSVDWKHESGFRYIFHHKTDTNREFIMTVIVFDMPGL